MANVPIIPEKTFKDRYQSKSSSLVTPDPSKAVIDDNFYAVGEMLQDLIFELRQVRFS